VAINGKSNVEGEGRKEGGGNLDYSSTDHAPKRGEQCTKDVYISGSRKTTNEQKHEGRRTAKAEELTPVQQGTTRMVAMIAEKHSSSE